MKKQSTLKTLATALGALLAASLVSIPAVSADENPFGMTERSDGYMVADRHKGGTDAEKPGMEAKGNEPGPRPGEPTEKEMMGTDAEKPGAGAGGSKLPRPPSETTREDTMAR